MNVDRQQSEYLLERLFTIRYGISENKCCLHVGFNDANVFQESPQRKAVFNTDSDSVAKPRPDNLDVARI